MALQSAFPGTTYKDKYETGADVYRECKVVLDAYGLGGDLWAPSVTSEHKSAPKDPQTKKLRSKYAKMVRSGNGEKIIKSWTLVVEQQLELLKPTSGIIHRSSPRESEAHKCTDPNHVDMERTIQDLRAQIQSMENPTTVDTYSRGKYRTQTKQDEVPVPPALPQ